MDKIDEVLTRGVERVYPNRAALEKVLRSGKKIKLYQGFDPSMPNLHLGNLVGLLKLKQFQDLGHEVIFLVGDFTAMIGDPTDKESVRPQLTRKQILTNCKNWRDQAGRVLKFSGKNAAKMLFNSQWLSKISFADLLRLSGQLTYQQMIKRDMFQKRLKKNKDLYLHEFLYPLMQGYDSVQMDVDLEIGGSDQMFNMLVGRDLMRKLKKKEKFVLTTKLLVDSRGEKVGKTAGNALFLNADPVDIFGGVMSFPDEIVILAFELLTTAPLPLPPPTGGLKPMELKKKLAWEIVKLNFGVKAAQEGQTEFERTFQQRKLPKKIKIVKLAANEYPIVNLLVKLGLAKSRGEAKRLIKQGAVEINKFRVQSSEFRVQTENRMVVRVGKRRFVRISC